LYLWRINSEASFRQEIAANWSVPDKNAWKIWLALLKFESFQHGLLERAANCHECRSSIFYVFSSNLISSLFIVFLCTRKIAFFGMSSFHILFRFWKFYSSFWILYWERQRRLEHFFKMFTGLPSVQHFRCISVHDSNLIFILSLNFQSIKLISHSKGTNTNLKVEIKNMWKLLTATAELSIFVYYKNFKISFRKFSELPTFFQFLFF